MRNYYNFGNDLYQKASNQFFFSSITQNVPQFMLEIKSKTLHDFDEDVFPNALEIQEYINYNGDYNDIKKMILRIFKNQIKSGEFVFNEENSFAQKTNLIILFSKYFKKLDNTAEDYIELIKNSLFHEIQQKYTKTDLILGGYDSYIDILQKGDFYENFKPKKKNFTGFPISLSFDKFEKSNNNHELSNLEKHNNFNDNKSRYNRKSQFDTISDYTLFTGRFSKNNLSLRTISKINNEKIFNFKKKIFTEQGNEISHKVPILNGKQLIEASDGFQYATYKNVIYYYDKFSSNVLSFDYKSTNTYNNINCDFYQLINTIDTPLNEKDFGKSNILKNLKGIFI